MESVKQFFLGMELDKRTAALLSAAACSVGAVVMLVRKISSHQQAKEKIRRARLRRDESLQRAEHTVLQYKKSHPRTDSALILSLSLSDLAKQLQEGLLSPEEVLHSYMEKVEYQT